MLCIGSYSCGYSLLIVVVSVSISDVLEIFIECRSSNVIKPVEQVLGDDVHNRDGFYQVSVLRVLRLWSKLSVVSMVTLLSWILCMANVS